MKLSSAEAKFNNLLEFYKNEGHEVIEETTPATDLFGERVMFSVYHQSIYISWTLQRKGGLNKTTSLRSFAMIKGKRAKTDDAAWQMRFNRKYNA